MHSLARSAIRDFPKSARSELGSALIKIQLGMSLGMPISRPMPSVAAGVYELRLRDAAGIYRAFYYLKSAQGILVVHAFVKKAQKTPSNEISIARKRLQEMLANEND